MLNRLAAILYFLTALATLNIGLALFNFLYRIPIPINFRFFVFDGIRDFVIPAIFFLASMSVVWEDEKLRAPVWITFGVAFLSLMMILIPRQHGWRLFLETAGPILSIILIVGFSVRRGSTIAGIGAVIYAIIHGPELARFVDDYFSPRTAGYSFHSFLAQVIPAGLATASLAIAIILSFKGLNRPTGSG